MTDGIAVIGMACRFPGADNLDQFWANLVAGVESITRLPGRAKHGYVPAAPLLADYDRFDAALFGYSPREAALLDPQQRVFLECAWTAVEHAGYDPSRYPGAIAVYAGSALNTYLQSTGLYRRLADDYVMTLVANDKDFLTSRVSYKLGLTGPSVTVQTACSTSLVAVHLACQALLAEECDMAIAGGVSVRVPQRAGYRFDAGGPLSPDGHCRAFDARAQGTVLGSGAGAVLVKRLDRALADGDEIYAVIKGSAVNNDGTAKVDYVAPSVTGQAEVIAEAFADAAVDPDTVSYVEAHGTATQLGDPVEIAALTKAFRLTTRRSGYCAIGSVKTNCGHLDAAAGIAGLIKTILALRHGQLPPSLHYERPNPKIDFPNTPFYVNTASTPWPLAAGPRRAAVSSLGIGGTNAHVVVEEAMPSPIAGTAREQQLIVLSAGTPTALDTMTGNLARHLAHEPEPRLADVAFTLQSGRKALRHRRMLVCHGAGDAVDVLDRLPPERVRTAVAPTKARPVVFVLPGGGTRQAPDVESLSRAEPVFRECVAHGIDELRSLTGDAWQTWRQDPAAYRKPSVQLPMIFLIEVALSALWTSWGVRPAALIGHSMGEVTAAHLAGVLTFRDALAIILARARLAESTPPGGMLNVALPSAELTTLLTGDLDLALVNTPDSCVVSGTVGDLDELRERLAVRHVATARVPVDSAGHSRLFDPFLPRFEAEVARAELKPPSLPFISNLTGTWITDLQATDPAYWSRQLRHTVRFADGVGELLGHPDRLFLEVGPGRGLSGLVRSHPACQAGRDVVSSLPSERHAPDAAVLDALGRLWLAGVDIDWSGFAAPERRRRVALPTYPFERERHWYGHAPRRRGGRLRTSLRWPRTREPGTPSSRSVAPRSPTEHTVAGIWRTALGIPAVSIHDDFFELGGSSLLVTQVINHVNQTYQTDLSFLTLVESPTIAELAALVDSVRDRGRP
jgi:acyl transferase domain-containing protein